MIMRVLVGVIGVAMGFIAVRWIVDPTGAAQELDMTLLTDGLGRSTQIGDFTAFFAAVAVMIFSGLLGRNATWLRAAALVLFLAAVFRTGAWLLHDAAFSSKYIAIELVLAIILTVAAAAVARDTSRPR